MPLNLPDLDDRRFDDLMAEARALIPALAPQWTNFNSADPGITLLELFAWLNEVLMYRINRVTDDNRRAFLALLNGPDWRPSADGDLARDVRDTVLTFRRCDRAVTPQDFETLALAADPRVAKAACIPERDLTQNPSTLAPAHVSVVIAPTGGGAAPPDLLAAVQDYLEPRRLLTTRLHIVAARGLPVAAVLTLTLKSDAVETRVRAAAVAAVTAYLHPLTGGPDGGGWPFGRSVFVSELYRLLGQVPGVDYVGKTGAGDELTTPDPTRRIVNAAGAFVGLRLQTDELPDATIDPAALALVTPVRA
jgi:hypothetical protein